MISKSTRAQSVGPEGLDPRRRIPAVGAILQDPRVVALTRVYGSEQVSVHVRASVEAARESLAAPSDRRSTEPELGAVIEETRRRLEESLGVPVRRVINATGILLHTNLGRAPLPREIAERLPRLLDAACDLEMDLVSGRRSDRNERAGRLLCALTGAASALVVNNNAAALLLALSELARDREVVVSRGELVEIGGSFRIPSILEAAGARLVEVGTTNRTRLADYRAAVGPRTALLLKVHPSNYRIVGFTESVGEPDLVALAAELGVPLLVDEGSGLLTPSAAPQLRDHRSLRELVELGCDLVCGSGDKLLGGPQAGLIVGRSELVGRLRKSPVYRAVRPDRSALVALEAVLRRRLAGGAFPLDQLWMSRRALRRRLEPLATRLGAEIVPADAFLGGGAAPEAPIPGEALALPGSDAVLRALRTGEPPVVGYLRRQRLILDLRTVDPRDDDALAEAVHRALAGAGAVASPEGGGGT